MSRSIPRISGVNAKQGRLSLFLAVILVAAIAGIASAQTTLRCESQDGRRHQCRFDGAGSVQLSRQLSVSACVQGQSWGVAGNAIWVDAGCRADFTLFARNDRNREGWDAQHRNGRNRAITVVCESKDGRRHRCTAAPLSHITTGDVTLERELTRRNRCVEGRSWGYDGDSIWVDRGCRAEFLVANNEGRREHRVSLQDVRTLTCESNSYARTYCRADTSLGVQLIREISRDMCEADRTWGVDEHGIWVSNGCRAEFELNPRR